MTPRPVRLVVLSGPQRGVTVEAPLPVVLGRGETCDVRLLGKGVSRAHARLEADDDGGVRLVDLGSRNGTLVNGTRRDRVVLAPGDELGLGQALLAFEPGFVGLSEEPAGMSAAAGDGAGDAPVADPDATRPIVWLTEAGGEGEPGADARTLDASETLHFGEWEGEDADRDPAAADPDRERLHRRLRALYRLSELLGDRHDPAVLLRDVTALAVRTVGGTRGAALLLDRPDDPDGRVRAVVGAGEPGDLPISRTVLRTVVPGRKGLVSGDVAGDPRFREAGSLAGAAVRSLLAAPLLDGDRVSGLLYVDTDDPARDFDDEDLRLLLAIGAATGPALRAAREFQGRIRQARELRRLLHGGTGIVGASKPMKKALDRALKAAETESTVLLTGETGTGKELVALAVHEASDRAAGPFTAVNLAAVPETMLERELFGHERGAFTGADRTRPGRFEAADGGTLFLDEVGELSAAAQSALLRALEERRVTRLGGVRPVPVDVRVIAATHRDLEREVAEGRFREDLWYRLAVVHVHLPPLRDRPEDIPPLVAHFLRRLGPRINPAVTGVDDRVIAALRRRPWPGNVRELRNTVERMLVLATGETLGMDDLPAGTTADDPDDVPPLADVLQEVERRHVERALRAADGVKRQAARILGISRPTLDRKIEMYDL